MTVESSPFCSNDDLIKWANDKEISIQGPQGSKNKEWTATLGSVSVSGCNSLLHSIATMKNYYESQQISNRSIDKTNPLQIEIWECHECGTSVPCHVEIVFSDSKLPSYLKGLPHFCNTVCLCREPVPPLWKHVLTKKKI